MRVFNFAMFIHFLSFSYKTRPVQQKTAVNGDPASFQNSMFLEMFGDSLCGKQLSFKLSSPKTSPPHSSEKLTSRLHICSEEMSISSSYRADPSSVDRAAMLLSISPRPRLRAASRKGPDGGGLHRGGCLELVTLGLQRKTYEF